MNEIFTEEANIYTLSFMADDPSLDELPDFTTLNNYLEKLSPDCMSGLHKKTGKGLNYEMSGNQIIVKSCKGHYED